MLEISPEYGLWEGEGGVLICGLAGLRGATPRSGVDRDGIRQVALPPRSKEPATVAAIFSHVNGALRLSDLVDAVALLLNVRDDVPSAKYADVAAPAADPDLRLDQRRILERLWTEIAQLPRAQRFALLLNLRDDAGSSALVALPATGVASIRQIAVAIEIPAEDLAAIWRELPLTDLEIAVRLGLSRQQVINLRKAARQRLARRMTAGNIGPEPPSKETNTNRV